MSRSGACVGLTPLIVASTQALCYQCLSAKVAGDITNQALNTVYQFKITLKDSKPPIWRRIQVPANYTFWDLHVAIQDSMGWQDCHLHRFEFPDPTVGIPHEVGLPFEVYDDDEPMAPSWGYKISRWFGSRKSITYQYDFGDDWRHAVILEKTLPRLADTDYPICVAGKRACPPEDCGGTWGYERLLEIMQDPEHEEYETLAEWLGGEIDSEYFDVSDVYFDDPGQRRNMLYW